MYTFSVTIKSTPALKETIRDISLCLDAKNHDSPFILGLNKLEAESKVTPKSETYVYRLRSTLRSLSISIPECIQNPCSKYTRESFDDLLYTIDQVLSKIDISKSERVARANGVRHLLGKNDQPLGDGTEVKTCLSDYVSFLKKTSSFGVALQDVSTISHGDLSELETKAKYITQGKLDCILQACKNDIDYYLKTCSKQSNFAKYKIDNAVKIKLFAFYRSGGSSYLFAKNRKVDILKSVFSFLAEQEKFKFNNLGVSEFSLPSGRNFIGTSEIFTHYGYGTGYQPWFYSQYRLPNFVLTSFFILMLIKTGWNVGSIAHLNTADIKKLTNGSYEIQAPKHKTDDETPKFVVSKADRYLKTCISLLIWNRSQLLKYGLLSELNGSVWVGWHRVGWHPPYPASTYHVNRFFKRHDIQRIPLSHIRTIKAACAFLNHRDMELVRVMLGHSNLDTTNSYLQSNLIFHLNEARILEFQKRLENTIANESLSRADFISREFNDKKVEPSLISRRTVSDFLAESEVLDDARIFLNRIGVIKFDSKSFVTADTVKQAILFRNYYSLRWRNLFDANPDTFVKNHLNTIIYINVFLKIAKQRKPAFFDKVIKDFQSRGVA